MEDTAMDVDGPAPTPAPTTLHDHAITNQLPSQGAVRDRPPTPFPSRETDDFARPSHPRLPNFRRYNNTAASINDEDMHVRTTRVHHPTPSAGPGAGGGVQRAATVGRFSESWTLTGLSQRQGGQQATPASAAPVPSSGILHDSTPTVNITRAPRDGWPRVEQRSFTSWRNGQSDRQAEAWRQEEGPLMVLQFAGHGAQDPGNERRIAAVQDILRTNFNIDTDRVRFVAAIPQASNHRRENSLPTYTAIFGLGSDNGRLLVRSGWISTSNVTFCVESVNITPPAFLGAFTQARHFGSLNPIDIAERVRETIRDDAEAMWAIYEIIACDANTQGRWAGREPDIVLEHLIDTLRVDILDYQTRAGVPEPLVRVYMDSPTLHAGDWNAFRDTIMGLAFGDDLTGNPAIFAGSLWCAICHGYDHPTELCPLLLIPGWNGPTLNYPTLRAGIRRNERTGGRGSRMGRHTSSGDRGPDDRFPGQRKRRDRDDDHAGGAASSSRRVRGGGF